MIDVETIFHTALEQPGQEERLAYLARACGEDTALRERVERLLAAHASSGDFLAAPAVPAPASREALIAEEPGDTIGNYVLLERLGEGGFGVVYRAEQQAPIQREVALKIIKLGMDTKQVIARFEAERQALALTDHENIARVFDAGATDSGRPFFVMELVRGVAIHRYCDEQHLTVPARIALMVEVCRAVQHAHQKGLVHRDLKPTNVLVSHQDGRGTPKVIDFGVAKATRGRLAGATLHTEFGQLLGTPAYMSPEQADLTGSADVDTRTDVYSLGVLLYEVLTGATPFDARHLHEVGIAEVQRILREDDPPAPSARAARGTEELARLRGLSAGALSARLRGDLDWITLRALEKDPDRRYNTPDALAADLLRHLERRPVRAGPPNKLYVLGKFVRRNQVAVTAGGAVVLALLLGVAFAAWGLIQVSGERDRANERLDFFERLVRQGDLGLDAAGLVARARELFGEDHGVVATALTFAAEKQEGFGDLSQAEDFLRVALDLWELESGDANVAFAHAQLGRLLLQRGELDEARTHLDQAVRLAERTRPWPEALLAEVQANRAEVFSRTGAFTQAAAALERSVASLRRAAPDQHGTLGRALQELADAYAAAGQEQQAARTRLRAVEELELAFPDTVIAADQLLALGLSLRRLPPALRTGDPVEYLRAGLQIYRGQPRLQGTRFLAGLVDLADELAEGDEAALAESDALWAEALVLAERLYGDSLEQAALLERRAAGLRAAGNEQQALELELRAGEVSQRAIGASITPEGVRGFAEKMWAAAAETVVPEDVAQNYELASRMLDLAGRMDPIAGPLVSLPDRALLQDLQERGVGPVGNLLALSIVAAQLGQEQWARSLLETARPLTTKPEARSNPRVASLLRQAEAALED